MKYISIEECLALIQEEKIKREKSANVYLGITNRDIVLEFAYSEDKQDHILLKQMTTICHPELLEEVVHEYLSVAMIIEQTYKVRRFMDDIRTVSLASAEPVVTNLGG